MTQHMIELRQRYLTNNGLGELANKEFWVTFIISDTKSAVKIPLKGYDDRSSAIDALKNIGFLSDDDIVTALNWSSNIVYFDGLSGPLIAKSLFVCQLKDNTIYLSTRKKGSRIDPRLVLYGCPNALIQDADKLKERRRINIRKYE